MQEPQELTRARDTAHRILENCKEVIIGKDGAVELGVITLVARGHALVEDVPGVGKTMLARSIARSAGCSFKRIQFTPDLLPSDVTGVSIYNQKTGDFEFKEGPILAQFVLTDEINRATPKTQSSLLEAMEERQVTVEGVTHPVPQPFMVIATQNPIEYEGTFPLPEAQLDRFLLRITLGYPGEDEELAIVDGQQLNHPIESLEPVASPEEITELQTVARQVYVDDLIKRYVISIISRTREHADIALGSSPRGTLALVRGAQAMALVRGRDYALPDDIKELASPMIGHRIIVSAAARMRGLEGGDVVEEIVNELPGAGSRRQGLAAWREALKRLQGLVTRRFYLVLCLGVVCLITASATGFDLFLRLAYILALAALLSFWLNWQTMRDLTVTVDRRTRRARVGGYC